jgi:hypothetical protein
VIVHALPPPASQEWIWMAALVGMIADSAI